MRRAAKSCHSVPLAKLQFPPSPGVTQFRKKSHKITPRAFRLVKSHNKKCPQFTYWCLKGYLRIIHKLTWLHVLLTELSRWWGSERQHRQRLWLSSFGSLLVFYVSPDIFSFCQNIFTIHALFWYYKHIFLWNLWRYLIIYNKRAFIIIN